MTRDLTREEVLAAAAEVREWNALDRAAAEEKCDAVAKIESLSMESHARAFCQLPKGHDGPHQDTGDDEAHESLGWPRVRWTLTWEYGDPDEREPGKVA